MRLVLQGRVFSKSTSEGVYAATLELVERRTQRVIRSQRTSRDGAFVFHLTLDARKPNPASLLLRVRDDKKAVLGEEKIVPIAANVHDVQIDVPISGAAFVQAKLPRQPERAPILRDTALTSTRAATLAVQRLTPNLGAEGLLASYLCSLPPLLVSPGLLDSARGVLAGRGRDFEDFAEQISDLTLFSQRNGFKPPAMDKKQARAVFSRKHMAALSNRLKRIRPQRESIVARCRMSAIAVATARVYRDDLVALVRSLAVLDHQLSVLDHVHRLEIAGRRAINGGPPEFGQFFERLRLFGSGCGGDAFEPIPGDDPFGPFPGTPGPQPGDPPDDPGHPPDPGGTPWPGTGSTPFPIDPEDIDPEFGDIPERLEMWACLAEFFRRGVEFDEPYSITSIEPSHACPGDEVTITGTDLTYNDLGGEVHFSGPRRGTTVLGDVVEWSETKIRVIVPEGAVCGPVELRIPESHIVIPSCGELDLFFGPSEPFRFEGGETIIKTFRNFNAGACGYEGGGTARFTWTTCNAASVGLTLRGPSGVVADLEGLDPNDSVEVPLPVVTEDTFFDAELVTNGPCSTERWSLRLLVHRALPDAASLSIPLEEDAYRNWHRNLVGRTTFAVFEVPGSSTGGPLSSAARLVDVVHAAGVAGARLGIVGSLWSYSNCVAGFGADAPDWLLSTECSTEGTDSVDMTDCRINEVLMSAVYADAESVLDDATLARFAPADPSTLDAPPPVPPTRNRLVHVKAGLKLAHLNCMLESNSIPLAMATLGGSNGQSIAGAISTGTHGTNPTLPPIQDFVRAIHLVGPGGKQWWIEPESAPVTVESEMRELMASRVLDPCLELVYDDPLFDACLVSLGAAGVIYSVVIEAMPKYHLTSTTERINLARAREIITNDVLGPSPPFFAEFVLGPNGVVHYTHREPAHPSIDAEREGESEVWRVIQLAWLAEQVVTRVLPSIPLYLADLVTLLTTPVGWFDPDAIFRRIRLLETFLDLSTGWLAILTDPSSARDVAIDATVNLLNMLFYVQTPVVDGLTFVEDFHNKVISMLRPPGTLTKNSFEITNEQLDSRDIPAEDRVRPWCKTMTHDDFVRRTQSYEYVMPAADVLGFVDEIRFLEDDVKRTAALILTVNIRFTRGTRASLGMQQFDPSGYVEIWTVRGMHGSDDFHRKLEELTRDRNAIPHWGHYHRRFEGGQAKNFRDVYPRLDEWRAQLDRIALGADDPNTFRHGFVRERDLLPDL